MGKLSVEGDLLKKQEIKKLYTIHRQDPDGTIILIDYALTKAEAKEKAQDRFSLRLERDSHIIVKEERELFRFKPRGVGFRF